MASSFKTEMQSARAFGSGDWEEVIEIESEALKTEEHKQYGYTMIAMAYENKGDIKNAKEYYGLAISIDECCTQALEGLAGIYAKEQNHDVAYQYVLRGLHLTGKDEFGLPRSVKLFLAMIIKILRPSRKFSKIYEETMDMDQSRKKWTQWATNYKKWYESRNEASGYENIH